MGYNVDGEWVDEGPTMAELETQGNQQSENFNANTSNADAYEASVNTAYDRVSAGNNADQQATLAQERAGTEQGKDAAIRQGEYDQSVSERENESPYETVKWYSDTMKNMLGLEKSVMTGGANTNPQGGEESGFMKDLMKGIFAKENSNLVNLGANFLAGMFNQKYKNAQSAAVTKSAEANMMNAQTAQAAQNLQEAGSKAMGLINMPQAPIKYQNLLAERRARSGAK